MIALATVALGACASGARPALGPPPTLPEPKRVVRAKAPAEWFWEAIEPEVRSVKKLALPPTDVVRTEGAVKLWDELGAEGQERLRRDAIVVLDSRAYERAMMGGFYMELREQRIPYVVTLDALFYAVHVALERALAEVEDTRVVPALDELLSRLGARLGTAQRGADTELVGALGVARGIVAVAAALDGLGRPPADLASIVGQETAAIDAHAGVRPSPLLGVPIDYARFAVPTSAAHPMAYKALAWLATAPLALVARTEARGAMVDVATARRNARAAMFLSHLVDEEGGDAKLHEAYVRIAKLLAFVWGPPDDVSLAELSDAADALRTDLGKPDHVADVTKVDRLRKRASIIRAPRVFDGAGAPGKAGVNVRVFGGHAPLDSALLEALAAPHLASRSLPSTLDVAAWLGGTEARACLREEGGDGAAGYDEALARAARQRPADDAIHASVHGSLLDAIGEWLRARGPSPAAERASVESALAAWTWLRHDGRALARGKPGARAATVLRVPGAGLPAFVEPSPLVIARLLATVRQIERGLATLGPMNRGSSGLATLAEVDDLLSVALRAATREVNDEPLGPEDIAALASFPARLARVETDADAQVPVAADLYTDLRSGRALTSATGLVELAVMLVREPGTGRIFAAAGAHVAQHEIVDPIGQRTTDASLRARLDAGLSRPGYARAFRSSR